MEFIDKLYTTIQNIEEKRFYQYVIGFFGVIVLVLFIILFQYYRSARSLKGAIAQLNEARDQARTILSKGEVVQREQREINALITKDEKFKIGSFFENLVAKLGLAQKQDAAVDVTTHAREGKYRESDLTAKFSGMSMKEITELLRELEMNRRIFTRELELTTSQKIANSIDVTLTIATLEPKPKEGTETEG